MIGWPFGKKIARNPPTSKPVEQARETSTATVGSMKIAMRHHQAGRWLEAQALYRQILSSEPENIDASHFLGVLLLQNGKHPQAGQMISQALQLNATNPPAHNNLGLVLLAQGKKSDAATSFRKALALAPDYLDALSNLGNSLVASGDLDEAVATYRRALLIAPENAELWFTLGNALYAKGERDSAVASYREAIKLKPAYPEAHSNLGSMLKEQGKLDLAVASYEEAVKLNPQYFEALYNLGVAQRDLGRYGEAVHFLRKALALRPDSAVAYFCLGHLLSDEDHRAQALECFSKALALNPEYQEARWSLAISQLPAVHGMGEDPQRFRAAFSAELHSLEHWCNSARSALGENTVGTQQPFRLAYQEEDNRPLLERYGRLCVRLMSNWQQRAGLRVAEIRKPGPIRVGFVSQHFRNHSVWNALIKGWIQQLDTRRFELHLFCIGNTVDSETQIARSRAARFEQGSHGLHQWTRLILDAHPDVLIYPEIGMDPMSLRLASMRLAPLQAASWGHPETTGLPTIDAYLSAQALEPDAAQANYTERLIALPGLGCYLQKSQVEFVGVDLSAWGVGENIPKLICAGTPFKYAPQHDWVFPEIARRPGFRALRHLHTLASERRIPGPPKPGGRVPGQYRLLGLQHRVAGGGMRPADRDARGAFHARQAGERHTETHGPAGPGGGGRGTIRGAGGAAGTRCRVPRKHPPARRIRTASAVRRHRADPRSRGLPRSGGVGRDLGLVDVLDLRLVEEHLGVAPLHLPANEYVE